MSDNKALMKLMDEALESGDYSKLKNFFEKGKGGLDEGLENSGKGGKFEKEIELLLENTRARLLRNAQNTELKKMVDFLYREGATYGNGSTGSMIREEIRNGTVTSLSGSHLTKAEGALNSMRKLLKGNFGVLTESDRKVVFEIIEDLTTGTGLTWKF